MRTFFTNSAVLLLSCCVQTFSKDIRLSAFPAAVFAPDGRSVYYVQSDLGANVRKGSFRLVYARSIEIRIISEVISIHKLDLATSKNEIIATLPPPPWVGTGEWVPRVFWFDGESAKMGYSTDGELWYEIHGPTSVTLNGKVRQTTQADFVSSDPKWTYLSSALPEPTLRTELKDVVSGSIEVVTTWRYGDQGSYSLAVLDHDRRTVRLLATGSDRDRKLTHSYKTMLYSSRLKAPL